VLAAVLTGVDDLRVQEVPTPTCGPGEVLVRVGANTVCGTDGRILRGEKTSGVELPVVLGHETAGHVAEVGRGVSGFEVGQPVAMCPAIPCGSCWPCQHGLENVCANLVIMGYAIDGGMAEHMLVPAFAVERGHLFAVSDDLPSEQLALAEPLACVVLGQRWAGMTPDDSVLILGAGPIGLLHLQLALHWGARAVVVSQPSAARRATALRLGATVAVDPRAEDLGAAVAEATGGLGVDLAIVCTGVPELVDQAVKLCRPGGRVSLFAGFKGDGSASVAANRIHYEQIKVTGSSNSRRADFETALALIAGGHVDAGALITHRFGLADAREAIGMIGHPDALKIAVTP
jgi:L-iditol 2-dehydrogenase